MGKMKQMMGKMTGKTEESLPDVDTAKDDEFLRQVNHDQVPNKGGPTKPEDGGSGIKPVS